MSLPDNLRGRVGPGGVALVLAVLLLLSLAAIWRSEQSPTERQQESVDALGILEQSGQAYLRAAHWFGDGWPVNMWNTDLESRATEDFQRILDDGFNTVVLLVPWPGFAPDPASGRLDEERVSRLAALMRLADEMGLKTVLRVSYAWDSLDDFSHARFINLWLDETLYQGWLDYLEAIWAEVHDIPGLQFGFFSWEDLWAGISLTEGDEHQRRLAAQASGFADWLIDEVDPERLQRIWGHSINSPADVTIPGRREPAFEFFIEFISHAWVDRFFLPAQARFPRLSMEVRIDADPIFDGDELISWFHHYRAWDLPGANWLTLYWSPAMGGINQGEEISPQEAVERLDYWLSQVAVHSRPQQIFIGQFLVEDFTPGYEMNGRLARERVGEFLELAVPVLEAGAGGVGLWTWTDYGHDFFGNPGFFAGLEGWQASQFGVDWSESGVTMEADAWLADMEPRRIDHAPGGPSEAQLCIFARSTDGGGYSALRVYQGSEDGSMAVLAEFLFGQTVSRQCQVHAADDLRFRFVAQGPLQVERISSIGFVQKSGMRDLDFALKPVGADYRHLNARLQERPIIRQPRFDDGWMGRFWIEPLSVNGFEQPLLVLETRQPADWPVAVELALTLDGHSVGSIPCSSDGRHVFRLDSGSAQSISLFVESSETHRPYPDQRDLGCRVDWEVIEGATGLQ